MKPSGIGSTTTTSLAAADAVVNDQVASCNRLFIPKSWKLRSSYHNYEPEMKAKIGHYAAEKSNKAAITNFFC